MTCVLFLNASNRNTQYWMLEWWKQMDVRQRCIPVSSLSCTENIYIILEIQILPSFPYFLPDMLCGPIDLIWMEGNPFQTMFKSDVWSARRVSWLSRPEWLLQINNYYTDYDAGWHRPQTLVKYSRPRWSRGTVLEIQGLRVQTRLSTSPPRGTLSWGSRVWDFRLDKEPQAWKNRPLSKI